MDLIHFLHRTAIILKQSCFLFILSEFNVSIVSLETGCVLVLVILFVRFLRNWEVGLCFKLFLIAVGFADLLFIEAPMHYLEKGCCADPHHIIYSRAKGWSWHYRTDEQQQREQLFRLWELFGKWWRQLQQWRRGQWPSLSSATFTPAALQQ